MTDIAKYRRYAEKIPLFHGLEPEEVEDVIKRGKIIIARKGETIFHEGILGSNLFIVLSGKVGIYIKNQLITKCHVGDTFGEMAVLNKKPRTATAMALEETRLLCLDEKQISDIFEKHVAVRLLLNTIHILSERLEKNNSLISEMKRIMEIYNIPIPEIDYKKEEKGDNE
ncbi:MAG TPA: cyclic nucleotide-binding domain-containing protein [Candidatus Hydrogenedens sp.]|nr:cyclic nucleotide-binding domain-containing protein [Candidatus Hydrogenedens sp.]HOK08202.1 cyclic nucleotide-binding domain-containing protein [Candidatus Hydrogenedens sp.]HOL20121.1 cyclic nucleotide-binding domain-containing protein [Candidatus Hydrogenedens sp.]HPP58671.1 cyclic nucleotide-binding domain-containing protein [Candidatus Hydrogenedens sp.]